nr:glycosyltransferase family 25 protein [Pseudomonadota bacterium]
VPAQAIDQPASAAVALTPAAARHADMPARTRLFVVSLARTPERRATFAARAGEAGIEWQFFDACEGLAEGLNYDEAQARLHYGRPLKASELGCYSSHFQLWSRLLDDDAAQYIILEDDVIADWAMLRIVAQTDFAGSDANYLRLYYKSPCPHVVRKRRYLTRNSHLLELFGPAYGTQGYVITRAAAQRLVPWCRNVTRPIDDQLDRFWEHGVPTLCLFPFPLVEEARGSTIGDDRFSETDRSLKRRMRIARDLARRRAAILRRRALRQDWTAIAFPGEPEA